MVFRDADQRSIIETINGGKSLASKLWQPLESLGISEDFLCKHVENFDPATLVGSSDEYELRDAIKAMVPRQCGVPLIRHGSRMDGGYLVPDDLTGIESCFSPGTNNFKDFEDELAQRYGIKSYMCDYTSDVTHFQTPVMPGMQFFEKKWLDVEGVADSVVLGDWVEKNSSPKSDLILQMNIEGAEYRNLIAADDMTVSRFRIIVIELHGLKQLESRAFLNGAFLPMMRRLAVSHICIHAHANNCCGSSDLFGSIRVPEGIELTFLRKDRIRTTAVKPSVPNLLDQVNVLREPPIHLNGIWLSEADEVQSRITALEKSVEWLINRVETLKRHNHFLSNQSCFNRNVAHGKVAMQSSASQFPTVEGAAGAVSGRRTGSFAFHTDIESDPWWMLDLQVDHRIDGCLIFNRMDGGMARADTLQLLTCEDGGRWELRYDHSHKPTFGGVVPCDGEPPLFIALDGIVARHIKLQLRGVTALHLDSVEVFGEIV